MKTIFTWLHLFLIGSSLSAQIPNSGFENWISEGAYQNPVGWWTANDSVSSGSLYPVSRSDDHYPQGIGQYSLQLQNNLALQPSWAAWGISWSGDFSGNDHPAFEISGHPNKLYGYYKFLPENGDTFEIHLRLYQDGVDVGGGQFKKADAHLQWSAFEIIFSDYLDADSARIMMMACYSNDAPMPLGNSVAFMDNLSFDSLIVNATDALQKAKEINIWPNPTAEFLEFSVPNLNAINDVWIYSIEGTLCIAQNTASLKQRIDVSSLPQGIYGVVFSGADSRHVARFVKQ